MKSTRTAAGLTAATVAGLTLLTLATPASAAAPTCPSGRHYAPGAGCVHNGLSFEHRNFCPGEMGTFKLVGFQAGSTITATFGPSGKRLGSYPVDAGQVANGSFTVPSNANVGVHKVTVTGTAENGKPTSVTRTFRVVKQCHTPDAAGSAGGASATMSGAALRATPARTTGIAAVKASADSRDSGTSTTELGVLAAAGLLLTGAGPVLTRRTRRRRAS